MTFKHPSPSSSMLPTKLGGGVEGRGNQVAGRRGPRNISLWVQWEELQNITKLGEGSMSAIFSCRWRGNQVVVKIIRDDCPDYDVSASDLELELQVLRQLNHPQIVQVLGAGVHPSYGRFVLLEHLQGGTLTDVLRRAKAKNAVREEPPWRRKSGAKSPRGQQDVDSEQQRRDDLMRALDLQPSRSPLTRRQQQREGEDDDRGFASGSSNRAKQPAATMPPSSAWLLQVAQWSAKIAGAMQFLHDEAKEGYLLLHRDLKPDNIAFAHTMGPNGETILEPKIIDFGLAKLVKKRPSSTSVSSRYRMTGETGSPRYMAPECHRSLPYNEKVDVYSFAMCIWEMVQLEPPFMSYNDLKHFRSIVVEQGVRPQIYRTYWPPSLANLVRACWSPDPDARPSFKQIGQTLQGIIAELEVAADCAAAAEAANSNASMTKLSPRKKGLGFYPAFSLSPGRRRKKGTEALDSPGGGPLTTSTATSDDSGFMRGREGLLPTAIQTRDNSSLSEENGSFRTSRAVSAPQSNCSSPCSPAKVPQTEDELGKKMHNPKGRRSIAKIQATFARLFSMSRSNRSQRSMHSTQSTGLASPCNYMSPSNPTCPRMGDTADFGQELSGDGISSTWKTSSRAFDFRSCPGERIDQTQQDRYSKCVTDLDVLPEGREKVSRNNLIRNLFSRTGNASKVETKEERMARILAQAAEQDPNSTV